MPRRNGCWSDLRIDWGSMPFPRSFLSRPDWPSDSWPARFHSAHSSPISSVPSPSRRLFQLVLRPERQRTARFPHLGGLVPLWTDPPQRGSQNARIRHADLVLHAVRGGCGDHPDVWGVAAPMSHFTNPLPQDVDAGSAEAAKLAIPSRCIISVRTPGPSLERLEEPFCPSVIGEIALS